jgi:putative restriction endonuclease
MWKLRWLRELLREFGSVRRSLHPEYPFWRMQRDPVWEVHSRVPLRARTGNTDPARGELLKANSEGGFPPEIDTALRGDPALTGNIAHTLLDAHFPSTLHEDILAAVGLDLESPIRRQPMRDPAFRTRVLTAYDQRCAICGFDVRMGGAQSAF